MQKGVADPKQSLALLWSRRRLLARFKPPLNWLVDRLMPIDRDGPAGASCIAEGSSEEEGAEAEVEKEEGSVHEEEE